MGVFLFLCGAGGVSTGGRCVVRCRNTALEALWIYLESTYYHAPDVNEQLRKEIKVRPSFERNEIVRIVILGILRNPYPHIFVCERGIVIDAHRLQKLQIMRVRFAEA
jgi:hypothetical protein